MSATGRIALGVASGYLLGRTKKFRLALTVGSMLAGKRIATDSRGLLQQGTQLVDSNPELSRIRDQITGQLMQSARNAAMATATSRLQSFTQQLELGSPSSSSGDEEDEEEYDEDEGAEDETAEDEGAEDETAEDETAEEEPQEEEPPRRRRP